MVELRITEQHVLEGDDVELLDCEKHSGLFQSDDLPDMVVIHYTASGSVNSAVRTLIDVNVKASAHLVIGRQGEIKQLVPFNKIAWHAGRSEYQGRNRLNHCSIGIELENAGRLTKLEDKYVSWFGRTYSPAHVLAATHENEQQLGYWHLYTEKQIECVHQVCELLREQYQIEHIVGHDDIAPGRKTDPGPAFPLEKLRQRILENDRQSDDEDIGGDVGHPDVPVSQLPKGVVTASALNIRKQPNASGELLCDPLPKGTSVRVLEEKQGWLKVNVVQTGWVKKDFVRMD